MGLIKSYSNKKVVKEYQLPSIFFGRPNQQRSYYGMED